MLTIDAPQGASLVHDEHLHTALRTDTLRCWVHDSTADAAGWHDGDIVTVRSTAPG